MTTSEFQAEILRIERAYDKRKTLPADRNSLSNLGNLCIEQEVQRSLLKLLGHCDGFHLQSARVLDVGCGRGQWLRDLISWGAQPGNLVGIDLLPEPIARARELSPTGVTFICGSAHKMGFDIGSFDVVMQATMFSSVLAPGMKMSIASEMLRVLKPGGFIIWYDFHVNNPHNLDVKGIDKKEIQRLFPTCRIETYRITLAPPLARIIGHYSSFLYAVLSASKLLCTHYLALIHKPASLSAAQL